MLSPNPSGIVSLIWAATGEGGGKISISVLRTIYSWYFRHLGSCWQMSMILYVYIGYMGISGWNLFPVLGHLTLRSFDHPWALYLARCACLTAVQSHSDSLLNKCPDPGGVREEAGPTRSLPFPVSYICRYSCTLKSSLLERRKPYVSPYVSITDCPPSFLFLPPIKTCESLVICYFLVSPSCFSWSSYFLDLPSHLSWSLSNLKSLSYYFWSSYFPGTPPSSRETPPTF